MSSPYDYLLGREVEISNHFRAEKFYQEKRDLIEAYVELIENEFTINQLLDTQFAKLGNFAAECDKAGAEGKTINAIKLIKTIRDNGLDPTYHCLILVDNDGNFFPWEGSHRACLLKAMGMPVPGVINKIQSWPPQLTKEQMKEIAKKKDPNYGK